MENNLHLWLFVSLYIVRGSFIETENGSLPLANFLPPLHQNKLPWQFHIHFNLKRKEKLIYDGSRNSFVNTVSQVSSSQKGSGNLSTVNQNW